MKTKEYRIAAPREYVDKGATKTKWATLGYANELPDGKIVAHLDTIPTGVWDGLFYLFPNDRKDEEKST